MKIPGKEERLRLKSRRINRRSVSEKQMPLEGCIPSRAAHTKCGMVGARGFGLRPCGVADGPFIIGGPFPPTVGAQPLQTLSTVNLYVYILVGARGFEPPTPASRTRCATGLRYAPTKLIGGRTGVVCYRRGSKRKPCASATP